MFLNELQTDAMTELINIGVGRAAASLSEMLNDRIELNVPSLEVCTFDELTQKMNAMSDPLDVTIVQDFSGGVSGRALLCFPRTSGIALAQVLMGRDDESDNLDLDLVGILEEVGNIVLNSVLGTIGNLIANFVEQGLDYSVPLLHADSEVSFLVGDYLSAHQQEECHVLLADAKFDVEGGRITGSLIIAFDLGCIKTICNLLLGSTDESPTDTKSVTEPMCRAKDIMTASVISVSPDSSFSDAIAMIVDRRISGLLVIDDAGKLVGVLSEADRLRLVADSDTPAVDASVAKYMTRSLISVKPDAELVEIADILMRHGIRRVPVVDEGTVVGIISRHDVMRAMYSQHPDTTKAMEPAVS